METTGTAQSANIGKSVVIKGEISGTEDLFLDGKMEGSIQLEGHRLTIGPNGEVRANITAGAVIVAGKLHGNIRAADRAELKKTAVVTGDLATRRVVIEDGAYLKGSLEITREAPKVVATDAQDQGKSSGAGSGSPAPPAAAQGVTKTA
jgi:cytoskeletal protein CcmA (bactofilin family)